MKRVPVGNGVGVDLLLSASDAFVEMANGLVAVRRNLSDGPDTAPLVEWAQQMAEFAAWWAGRLEAESDHVAGFGALDVILDGADEPGEPERALEPPRRSRSTKPCRGSRRRRPG